MIRSNQISLATLNDDTLAIKTKIPISYILAPVLFLTFMSLILLKSSNENMIFLLIPIILVFIGFGIIQKRFAEKEVSEFIAKDLIQILTTENLRK